MSPEQIGTLACLAVTLLCVLAIALDPPTPGV